MKRRTFMAGLGSDGGAGAATGLPVIGYLSTQSADGDTNRTVPFRRGLKETGYVDGKNVAVEYRHAKDIE